MRANFFQFSDRHCLIGGFTKYEVYLNHYFALPNG